MAGVGSKHQVNSEHFVPDDITFRHGRWTPTDFAQVVAPTNNAE